MGRGTARWKMLQSRRPSLGNQRGVALIEFALVLPMILLLLLGTIDVGKAVNYWNDETHLANEAARYAAVNKSPVTGETINQAVHDEADSAELRNGGTGSVSSPGVQICIWFPQNLNTADDPVRDHNIGNPVQVACLLGRQGPADPFGSHGNLDDAHRADVQSQRVRCLHDGPGLSTQTRRVRNVLMQPLKETGGEQTWRT